MKRRKRYSILRIALGLAIMGMVPITAQAKPMPYDPDVQSHGRYEMGPGEIPYLSQNRSTGLSTRGDRAGYPAWAAQLETPYWWSKPETVNAPDNGSLARPKSVHLTPVVSEGGRSIDFDAYTVTGSVVALLLAIGGGMGVGVWYSRKTRLSPA